jgi:hypothetical protein
MHPHRRRSGWAWEWWAVGGLLLLLAGSAAFYHREVSRRLAEQKEIRKLILLDPTGSMDEPSTDR